MKAFAEHSNEVLAQVLQGSPPSHLEQLFDTTRGPPQPRPSRRRSEFTLERIETLPHAHRLHIPARSHPHVSVTASGAIDIEYESSDDGGGSVAQLSGGRSGGEASERRYAKSRSPRAGASGITHNSLNASQSVGAGLRLFDHHAAPARQARLGNSQGRQRDLYAHGDGDTSSPSGGSTDDDASGADSEEPSSSDAVRSR